MAVNNSGIFYMDDANTETLASLLEQLDRIIGYGKRSDGKWYLADACQSSRINKWAYHKPIKANTSANLTSLERLQAGHGLVQNSSTFYIDYDRVTSGWWSSLILSLLMLPEPTAVLGSLRLWRKGKGRW